MPGEPFSRLVATRVATVCRLDLAYPRAQRICSSLSRGAARSGRSAVVHVHSRSSRHGHTAACGVRAGSRARTRRRTQPCATPAPGHVAARVVRIPTPLGDVPVRGDARRRVTVIDRTPVRSGSTSATRSRLTRLVIAYQKSMEGRPSPCRFTPSCSSYAVEALDVHGTWRGLWLTVRRLLRCRPFGPSGFDPVPLPGQTSDHSPDHSPDRTRRSAHRKGLVS